MTQLGPTTAGTWQNLYEWARCFRHNLLHLKRFHVRYRSGIWSTTDGDVSIRAPYYPYLAFHDIEGYMEPKGFRPEPGMTVLDVGGCYGEYALYASMCVGDGGRVIMIEPDNANVQVARRLFEMNGNPRNITIYQGGLWNKPGTVAFQQGLGAQSAVTAVAGSTHESTDTQIPVHSLSSLVAAYGLERLDLVKMDIEGAELQAIEGALELPRSLRPKYAIASYHLVDGQQTAAKLPGLFRQLGYSCRTGNQRHLTTWAWPS